MAAACGGARRGSVAADEEGETAMDYVDADDDEGEGEGEDGSKVTEETKEQLRALLRKKKGKKGGFGGRK